VTAREDALKLRNELLSREHVAREEAENANRAKDEFLATVSHELRTPLNAILGWAHMLRTSALDQTTQDRALETIERNARSQAQLIEDILDVSRIVTGKPGKLRLDVRAVELASVVESAIDAVRPAADAKEIRIHSILDPRAGPVSGDPNRLQQVVWNLASNAVKFTGKGGQVQIRLQRVNSHVEISVSDTGQGITHSTPRGAGAGSGDRAASGRDARRNGARR
jgi:signal transduction histidine kinase